MRIAAVAVDLALPHLDRTFDYRVPPELEAAAAVGQRVRVRFAGRLVSGFILALHDDASHATAELRSVVGPVPALLPHTAALVRAVADRYASTFADVVRFAVPARHAKAEAAALEVPPVASTAGAADAGPLAVVRGIPAFLERARSGQAVAACCEVPTRIDLAASVAGVVAAALAGGSVVVVVPDARDIARVRAALQARGITPIVMQAGDGPAARQRAHTAAQRAERAVVLGTRSAAFAPVSGPGITVVVGDGNDALVEQHTPGWHAREVALARGATQGWSSLFIGRHRSLELQRHVERGTVKALAWPVEEWRAASVRVEAVPERLEDADPLLKHLRIPPSAFRAMREALTRGPVALSVAQRGYITSVRCGTCREAARCGACSGPIGIPASSEPARCRVCGTASWRCPWCGGTEVRHQGIGSERTREELGRAFPNVPIRVVDADHPLEHMPDTPQLVVLTPGAEPDGRATLAVILDVDAALGRHDLSASIESLRRWTEVAAIASERVLVVGASTAPAVQALVRSDPVGFAERELAERAAVGLPPIRHAAVIEAPAGSAAASEVLAELADATLLGPVRAGEGQRWLVLHVDLAALTAAVRAMLVRRSAGKTLAGVGVRIDPLELAT